MGLLLQGCNWIQMWDHTGNECGPNDIERRTHDIGAMVELSEALFDIIGMEENKCSGEWDLKVCEVDKEVEHDHPNCAIKFGAQLGGYHHVDWVWIYDGSFSCIEHDKIENTSQNYSINWFV